MKTDVDQRLVDEAAAYALRHRCDDCVHFDGVRCGEAWPTDEHRALIRRAALVVFCKEFEMA